jgi:Uma2 family endonuclease
VTLKYCVGPPDLAIETMSPADTARDVDKKAGEWLNGGAHFVWLVNPQLKSVTVHRSGKAEALGAADTLDDENVVPGLQISVAEIFSI